LANYKLDRFICYRSRWEALNAYAGQQVEVRMATSAVGGVLLGVNDSGALRLRTVEGEQLFHGGEVSLRVAS
jgi:BirA family biotin operon repressor/biotin-[acetyl-CoA-carboxylase] ligase